MSKAKPPANSRRPRVEQELELLTLASRGMTTQQIATRLGRSVNAIVVWMYELRCEGKTKIMLVQRPRWGTRTEWKHGHQVPSQEELLAKARIRMREYRKRIKAQEAEEDRIWNSKI